MSNLGDLATSIHTTEFDSAASPTSNLISGWLDANLGKLNNVLFTSFSGSAGEVAGLNLEERGIKSIQKPRQGLVRRPREAYS